MRQTAQDLLKVTRTVLERRRLRKEAQRIGRFYSAPDHVDGETRSDVFIALPISKEELPESVQKMLKSRHVASEEYFVVRERNGLHTYIASLVQGDRGNQNRSVRVVDVFRDHVVGRTDFEHSVAPNEPSDPGNSSIQMWPTMEGFDKRGLGERRLLILDQFAQSRWDAPVSSSLAPSESAKAVWEKMVARGLARYDGRRYRFISRSK